MLLPRLAARLALARVCLARCSLAPLALRAAQPNAVRCLSSSAASSSAAPASDAVASGPDGSPLVAPAFGTNSDKDRRFVYIKGVKNDGRSKRFYRDVAVARVATARGSEWAVTLDGRFVVTPYNQVLSVPTERLAHALAFEWDAQGDYIRPISMPLSNIAVTALDQAHTDRTRFLSHFTGVMSTDSVMLRVTEPAGLVSLQRKHWDPLLKWLSTRYDVHLETTLEFASPKQPEESVTRLREMLSSLDGWQLAALDTLTTVTKSFVVSWALLTGRLTIPAAFEAARVEENFQMRMFGQVEGVYGHAIEMEYTRMSLAAARVFVNLARIEGQAQSPFLEP